MKDKIIEYFVDKGIEITIGKHKDYGIYYDLNTGMKSHAHLVFKEDCIHIYKRYGGHAIFKDNEDIENIINLICWEVKDCLHGRDFLNGAWEKLLIENDILTKHVETTTKVSYS